MLESEFAEQLCDAPFQHAVVVETGDREHPAEAKLEKNLRLHVVRCRAARQAA
jgi:hypothetical protein